LIRERNRRFCCARQGDVSAKPTDNFLIVEPWTPTDKGNSSWLAVLQCPQISTENAGPIKSYENLRRIIRIKLSEAGAANLDPPYATFYYAAWGSPANRIFEIWLPVSDAVAEVLRL